MIIKPKIRGFICTTAHPEGCAAHVQEQIEYTQAQGEIVNGPKNVLVLGCSTGYGLATRITAAFGSGAKTLGVCYEKPPSERKGASAGYYNTAAFHGAAAKSELYARTFNADAFSNECKTDVIAAIKADLGKIDLVVYSLASPRRTDPNTGITYNSVLKPIGNSYTTKGLNTDTLKITEVSVEPASEEEIANTVKVMGGEDWEMWVEALLEADVLADNCQTVSYTYRGDKITWPIYGHASIGKAKEDLDRAAHALQAKLKGIGGDARVAVLKAVVTQASSAIPIMPLYLSILFKVMKAHDVHEDCIEQIQRLFTECQYTESPRIDDIGRFRVDEKELDPAIQAEVEAIWDEVNDENLLALTDFDGHHANFLKLFGFGLPDIDYDAESSTLVENSF